MTFIKTTSKDSEKCITVVENNIIKGNYGSLLDMPREEMMLYIAQAFSETPDVAEIWAHQCAENLANANRVRNARQH